MDMSNVPVIATKHDVISISRKIRIADATAFPHIKNTMEHEQEFFSRCASNISTLAGLFTSRAFLGKIISDFKTAKDDLRCAFTQPSTGLTFEDDRFLLAACRYLETHPDTFVEAGFTKRQQTILTHRMTQHMERQPEYLGLIKEERTCNL